MEIKIGDKITEIMTAKGISQKELARATGIKQSNLSHMQNNKRIPSVKNLVKIADALYCKTDILLGR